ncbi:unnamed protein product [Clonostachys byssicola]|uniref:Alpha-L-rhamnosidase six-hairpin glycosidase domain-containing protein n=1 Tax=Clonostachys byssicola TaxID=160290 RepID=A0A9N9UVE0_9HYPO|nr:unnamed protein product [Clonostachys byssicola]
MALEYDRSWMWHPDASDDSANSAGQFVHFRKKITVTDGLPQTLMVNITADTRYKLCINNQQVSFGPVKGDAHLWFFDQVNIAPFLHLGENHVNVRVLRLYFATTYSPSFPRLPFGGLRIWLPDNTGNDWWREQLQSSSTWETAIDHDTVLRVDDPEDFFLHLYEKTKRSGNKLTWEAAILHTFKNSTGNSPPWNLSPRQIPPLRLTKLVCAGVNNVQSTSPKEAWESLFLDYQTPSPAPITLRAGTRHRIDLELTNHATAFLRLRFERPLRAGSVLMVTYSESYEDPSPDLPWTRAKKDRCDYSRSLIGPKDIYSFQGKDSIALAEGEGTDMSCEVFAPFHFRTFRFLNLDFEVGPDDLTIEGLDLQEVTYPLDVRAAFKASQVPDGPISHLPERLLEVSARTLINCMHDCYEDCPFYEQLQYAMDTRSSALFTYNLSGDDRMARQAIVQLHNSFNPQIGLTTSRAPSHRPQYIPNFSLYWVLMVCDHFTNFGDVKFTTRFLPVVDAVLAYFESRVDERGLVTLEVRPGIWNFVDWETEWKPHGIPPCTEKAGISTFGNHLYSYTLANASRLVGTLGRQSVAHEYQSRAQQINAATRALCMSDGTFCDTIASKSSSSDRSIHCQIWGVLSKAVSGEKANQLLRRCLAEDSGMIRPSVSMSFYTMRALSALGGDLYNEHFHQFWAPWEWQLEQNLTTWAEDDVCQRSDCHAWGSVPIYEFFSEVVGLKPKTPMWAEIDFRPRIGLYPCVRAKVPLCLTKDGLQGLACVSWTTQASGDVEIRFNIEHNTAQEFVLHASLPGQYHTLRVRNQENVFVVRADSFKRHYDENT